jgi:hypothetical protein
MLPAKTKHLDGILIYCADAVDLLMRRLRRISLVPHSTANWLACLLESLAAEVTVVLLAMLPIRVWHGGFLIAFARLAELAW